MNKESAQNVFNIFPFIIIHHFEYKMSSIPH
jgi:hypothetical protein